MTKTIKRRTEGRYVPLVVTTAVLYLLGTLVGGRIVALLTVRMEAGLAVALALGFVFGTPVAVGAGLGVVIEALVTGTFSSQTSFGFIAAVLSVVVGHLLWETFDRSQRFRGESGTVIAYAFATVPSVTTAAAVVAWGSETLARAPFSIVFESVVVGGMSGMLTVGVVAFLVCRRLAATDKPLSSPSTRNSQVLPGGRVALLTGIVPVIWGATGFAVSVILRPLQLEPRQTLVLRFGRTAAALIGAVGQGGRNLQLVMGTLVVGVLLALIFRDTTSIDE